MIAAGCCLLQASPNLLLQKGTRSGVRAACALFRVQEKTNDLCQNGKRVAGVSILVVSFPEVANETYF